MKKIKNKEVDISREDLKRLVVSYQAASRAKPQLYLSI